MNRPFPLRAAGAATLACALLGGCGLFKSNEEAQTVVSARAVGMPAGEFFDTFGRWRTRSEQPDGTISYGWESSVDAAPPGPDGLDQRVCKMRVIVAKAGRVASATIELDNPGYSSTSRCGELFRKR